MRFGPAVVFGAVTFCRRLSRLTAIPLISVLLVFGADKGASEGGIACFVVELVAGLLRGLFFVLLLLVAITLGLS